MSYTKNAYWEIFYPFLFTLFIGVAFWFLPNKECYDIDTLMMSSLNVFGILIGFLITVITIINSIDNDYIRVLKKNDSFKLLTLYLKHSIWGCFVSILIALCYVFIKPFLTVEYREYADTFFIASFVFAIISSYRFVAIFLRLTLAK